MNGHTKDNCPLVADYMRVGGPSPLRPGSSRGLSPLHLGLSRPALWCEDCCVAVLHDTNHCPRLGAYVPVVNKKWCKFCRLVGHDEQKCQAYDLMIDRGNLCRVQSYLESPRTPAGIGGSPSRGRGGGRGGSAGRG